jgi:anti-anti-sigma regulatory factor
VGRDTSQGSGLPLSAPCWLSGARPGREGIVSQEHPWDVTRALGRVVLTLRGPLDRRDAAHLEAILRDLVDDQGNLHVVVDLLQVDSVTPEAIEELRRASRSMAAHGGTLVLSAPTTAVAASLRSEGMTAVEAGSPLPQTVPVELVEEILHRLTDAALDLRTSAVDPLGPEADGALALIDGIVADLQRAVLEEAVGARVGKVPVPRELVGRVVGVELAVDRALAVSSPETSGSGYEVRVGLARAIQIFRRASTWR